MTAPRDIKQILSDFIREVWSEGDVEAADKYIAPGYTIRHDPGDPWEGKELDVATYKERVRTLRAAFPDQFFDIQGLFADGDAVVMTWLWSATHQGDIPGSLSGATAYFFQGDQFVGHWQITDRLGVFQQLQMAKAGAQA